MARTPTSKQNIVDINRNVYNAFSGCDMIAHINNQAIGTLNAITLSITREVVPIYTAGNPNPRCFVKGKRGLAGSMVFGTFDRHAITQDIFKDNFEASNSRGKAIQDYYNNVGSLYGWTATNMPQQSYSDAAGFKGNQFTRNDRQAMLNAHLEYLYSVPIKYSDEVPPFNVTITFVNENGAASTMSIYGIQLINETQAFTMDDLTNDLALTYVAREIDPMVGLTNTNVFTRS